MTREEAKENISEILNSISHTHNDLIANINKVYDDFESRTCENCKHGYRHASDMPHESRCSLKIYGRSSTNSKDFGCNRFERKTDGNV